LNIFDNQLIISSFVEWALAHFFTSFAEVISLDPVEVQDEMESDEGEQNAACAFMEKFESPSRQLIEKQNRYHLIDKKHEDDRI
jgi:hypothetical protein